jgi:tape measure domain-containing protein
MADSASLVVRVTTTGVRQTSQELDRLSAASNTANRAAQMLTASLAGVAAAFGVREVIEYADAWTTVTNKIANHVKVNESLVEVQERVFSIAQDTRSSLSATATLYGRLAAATGDYVKQGRTLGELVTNINLAMQVSGATTAEAEGALVQLSQAFGAGALRGEEFNSVNEAAPRLMKALADSLGVARGELKSLAADGKLTTEVLFTAWSGQSKFAKQVRDEFENLTATAAANLAVAENNLTKWIGTNNTAIAVTQAYGQAAISLSQNLDTVANAATLLAGVIAGKVVGSLVAATTSKVSSAVASHQLAAAELAQARAAEAAVVSEIALLQAQNATWASRIRNTQSEAMAARFRTQLAANTAQLTTLETSLAAASSRLAVAQTAAATGTRLFAGAMAMLGGPLGVAILAATAISVFSASANSAADPTATLSEKVRQLTSDFKTLEVARVDETISEVADQLDNLNTRLEIAKKGKDSGAIMPQAIFDKLDAQITEANSNLTKLQNKRAEILNGGAAPETVTFPESKKDTSAADAKKAKKAKEELERQRAQAAEYVEIQRQSNMDELQLIDTKESEKIATLEKYRSDQLISEQEYQAALSDIRLNAEVSRQSEIAKLQNDQRARQFDRDQILAEVASLNASELELLEIQEQQKASVVQRYRDEGLISEQEYQDSLYQIADETNKKRRAEYANILGQTTDDLKTALGEGNKAYKAFAIANAVMNTYQGAVAAYQSAASIPIVGWVAAPIAAAAAVAAGLANVAKIRSAREQGGNLSAGQMSTIAERGQPEVIMPASASRVRTAQQMKQIMGESGASSQPTTVQIVNQTTGRIDSATTERMDEATLRVIIRETVSGDLQDSNSPIAKSRRATRGQAGY